MIINHAKSILRDNLQESIYISLTDHIHFAIERHKQGFDIANSFLWEIQKFYPKEFKIAEYSLDVIKQRLDVNLPKDEAGFIAFHIINAQLKDTIPNIATMTKMMCEILTMVKCYFKFEYDEDSLTYQRFVTHLKFFSKRILNKKSSTSQDLSLYDVVKDKLRDSYLCTKQIDLHFVKTYQYPLTDDETLYLTLHIERLRNELQNL